jgi:hypothetical protein
MTDWVEEGERALRRAVDLDPGFAPYYLHLVDLAVVRGDSARARAVLETYRGLGARDSRIPTVEHLLTVAFADSAAATEALSAIDELEGGAGAFSSLGRSGRRPREFVAAATALRGRPDAGSGVAYAVFAGHLDAGLLEGALAQLDDPMLGPGARANMAFRLHEARLPVPEEPLEAVLTLSQDDSTDAYQTFYAGAYAADRGAWSDHARAVARLRGEARRSLAAGDTTGGRSGEGQARALEGFGLWRKGDRAAALALLKPAQRELTGYGAPEQLNAALRWWLGELLLEMDRPREAEPYFTSLLLEMGYRPFAGQRLGRLLVRAGDSAGARAAYERVTTVWRYADPELQPQVQEARAAIARLGGASE